MRSGSVRVERVNGPLCAHDWVRNLQFIKRKECDIFAYTLSLGKRVKKVKESELEREIIEITFFFRNDDHGLNRVLPISYLDVRLNLLHHRYHGDDEKEKGIE